MKESCRLLAGTINAYYEKPRSITVLQKLCKIKRGRWSDGSALCITKNNAQGFTSTVRKMTNGGDIPDGEPF